MLHLHESQEGRARRGDDHLQDFLDHNLVASSLSKRKLVKEKAGQEGCDDPKNSKDLNTY